MQFYKCYLCDIFSSIFKILPDAKWYRKKCTCENEKLFTWHVTHTHECTKKTCGIPNYEMNSKHFWQDSFWSVLLQQSHNKSLFYMMWTQSVYHQFTLVYLEAEMALSVYHFVWHRRLLTDVCWFEAMVNVPVKSAALCLIIRAHASVMGRWEAHEACVCSGKLLNCFCVYTKDHATENIILSSHLCAQRIWSNVDNGVGRRHEWFEKYSHKL